MNSTFVPRLGGLASLNSSTVTTFTSSGNCSVVPCPSGSGVIYCQSSSPPRNYVQLYDKTVDTSSRDTACQTAQSALQNAIVTALQLGQLQSNLTPLQFQVLVNAIYYTPAFAGIQSTVLPYIYNSPQPLTNNLSGPVYTALIAAIYSDPQFYQVLGYLLTGNYAALQNYLQTALSQVAAPYVQVCSALTGVPTSTLNAKLQAAGASLSQTAQTNYLPA